jgi:hypothetical protein
MKILKVQVFITLIKLVMDVDGALISAFHHQPINVPTAGAQTLGPHCELRPILLMCYP